MNQFTPQMPAGLAGALLLRQQLAVWLGLLPSVRAGHDPEALHQLRVCGRRLLAVLRVLEAAQMPSARSLRHQAAEMLAECGVGRDLDVQIAALQALCRSATPPVHPAFHRRMNLRRLAAQLNLRRCLDSARSRELLRALEVLTGARDEVDGSRAIAAVARDVIRDLHRSATRAARRVNQEPSLANCHDLRIATKKLRYVAEGFKPLYGEPLVRYLRRLQGLQSLLGRINDARQLIPVFEVEAARARAEGSAAALAVFDAEVDRQRTLLHDARAELRAQRKQLSGLLWRQVRVRMDQVAKRRPE